jgi:lysozyme
VTEVPPAALNLIRQFEGCILTAQQDIDGHWSIGFGHDGPEVVEGLQWTQEQADNALLVDAQSACDSVCRMVNVPLNPNRLAALTSFTFNLGSGSLQHSTLLIYLNESEYDQVPEQLVRWCKGNAGNTVPGLLRRRMAEIELWNTPVN